MTLVKRHENKAKICEMKIKAKKEQSAAKNTCQDLRQGLGCDLYAKGFSRSRLALLPVRANVLADHSLLAEVVRFKQRFYRCPWAHYERAVPGTQRLLPPSHRLVGLERDYREMRPMLFGDIPAFTTILEELSALSVSQRSLQSINNLTLRGSRWFGSNNAEIAVYCEPHAGSN